MSITSQINGLIDFIDKGIIDMTDATTADSGSITAQAFITPIKSPIDLRDYRILKLKNGLECVLISDGTTEKAAAAMTVAVGHFADPAETPGLAHFLEHMLFLGTEKYPNESEYAQFIIDNGGRDNASTGTHRTCFQFDIHSDYLSECIDRFAQFFIAPLFTESATDRELNAVDSENVKNLQNDAWRQFQFNKSLAKAEHPFSNFGSGNMKTLKLNLPADYNLREKLIAFHKLYYSSSIMKLCVLGKESLDELQQMIESTFTPIPSTDRVEPKYSTDAFDLNNFPKLYKIIPVKEQRRLRVYWVMDSVYVETQSLPTSMLSHLLGDEGPGSILAFLKDKDWATALYAGTDENLPEFCMFGVTIVLTVEGLENYTAVITAVYQYIHAVQSMTDDDWRRDFEERRKVREMGFNFQSKSAPYGYVTQIAKALMRNYDRTQFLRHLKRVLFQCDVDLYRQLSLKLTVENMMIQIISKDFESECTETEPWYSTKFNSAEIDAETLNTWKTCGVHKEVLHIPPENPYIAEDFSLFCVKNAQAHTDAENAGNSEEEEEEDNNNGNSEEENAAAAAAALLLLPTQGQFDECAEEPPELIDTGNARFQLWFKTDRVFRQPMLSVNIEYISLDGILDDCCQSKLEVALIMHILDNELSLYTYAFEEAGLSKSIGHSANENSLVFSFGGYNEKLHLLLETVLSMFANLKISQNKFDVQYEKLKRGLESKCKQQPYLHAFGMRTHFLDTNTASLQMIREAFNSGRVTFAGVCKKYQQIFSTNFRVKSLIYGNADRTSIQPYIEHIGQFLCSYEHNYESAEAKPKGCLKIPCQSECAPIVMRFDGPNADDQNSCCENMYFYMNDAPELAGVLKLFANVCDAACFDQLRTKEQLGYIVWSYDASYKGNQCFKIVIQSAKKTATFLNFRIESFLQNVGHKLVTTLDSESIEVNKKGLINNLLEKPKTLRQQCQRYWNEISLDRFQWQRRTQIADSVRAVTPEMVLAFYQKYIRRGSQQRIKVSVQCQTKYDFSKEEEKEEQSAANTSNADADANENENENKTESTEVELSAEELKYKAADVTLEQEMNAENSCSLYQESDISVLKEKFGYYEYPWSAAT